MKKIYVSDTTLKKLSSDREVSLLFREKTAIASCADLLGADVVELSAIKSVREDTIVYKTISQKVSKSKVAIPVGFCTSGIKDAWECIKDAPSCRLQVEVPVSTVQMEYMHHIKADKMLTKIAELTSMAKKYCKDVEFIAGDATRSDEAFLINAINTAVENGATCVTICDDAGISLCDEISELVKKVKSQINVPLYIEVSDRLSMAVANAIEAIKAGADGIKCAMAGDNVLSMGAISNAIKERGEAIGAYVALQDTKIHAGVSDMLSKISHEAYESSDARSEKKSLILDAQSTLSDVVYASKTLGYDLTDEDSGKVFAALMPICQKKGSVGAKEFEALIASTAMQAPSTYHLESYSTSCGNMGPSMSQITLRTGDEILSGVSIGDGPIDSVFRAIEQSIGYHYELDDFQIHSVTDGKEALGSALVKLRSGGKLYSGNGSSTDIIAASIRAYLNALNKIVFEEE